MIPLMAFIVGAFCGASIMWSHFHKERVEDLNLVRWLNEANESASEWLRRGQ